MIRFKDNKFNWFEWDVPVVTDPIELRKRIDSFNIGYRTIKNIVFTGSYFDNDAQFANWIDESSMEPKMAEIDEPLLIEFEDGDVLSVLFSDVSTVKIGMNDIPLLIDSEYFYEGNRRFDANVIFSDFIGRRIDEVIIEDSDDGWIFEHTGRFKVSIPTDQPAYIYSISFLFRRTNLEEPNLYLKISNSMDYCVVWEEISRIPQISFGELKKGFDKRDLELYSDPKWNPFAEDNGEAEEDELANKSDDEIITLMDPEEYEQ